jgi:hypothetical protein
MSANVRPWVFSAIVQDSVWNGHTGDGNKKETFKEHSMNLPDGSRKLRHPRRPAPAPRAGRLGADAAGDIDFGVWTAMCGIADHEFHPPGLEPEVCAAASDREDFGWTAFLGIFCVYRPAPVG